MQCGPSTTAQLCLQRQHTGNDPQLHAEQSSLSSFTATKIKYQKGVSWCVTGGFLSPAHFNYYLADFPTPPPNIRLIKYAEDITIYKSGKELADLINGLNIYMSQVLNYMEKKSDSVYGRNDSNTFHARYSRAPITSTSEVCRPSTAARKDAKSVRSDARHTYHFLTTLQPYRSKSAGTQ